MHSRVADGLERDISVAAEVLLVPLSQ